MKVTVKLTGEEIELADDSYEALVYSYQVANEYEKAYKTMKQKLAKAAQEYLDHKGLGEICNGYMFRHYPVQRMNYDKTILRQNLDEDTFNLLMQPDKKAIDEFLKDNLNDLGEVSTIIRQNMVPIGKPYTVTKLEKVER